MTLQTKFVLTVISMVLCICILVTGVYASSLGYDIGISNFVTIREASIQGELYGERYGAGSYDIFGSEKGLLYSTANGINSENMTRFTQDVSFAPGSASMEYLFLFIRPTSATSDTWVYLEDVSLSENDFLNASYKYGYGATEPSWNRAEKIDKVMQVTSKTPYLWIRIQLTVRQNSSVPTVMQNVIWTFNLRFEGVAVTN